MRRFAAGDPFFSRPFERDRDFVVELLRFATRFFFARVFLVRFRRVVRVIPKAARTKVCTAIVCCPRAVKPPGGISGSVVAMFVPHLLNL